MIEKKPLYRTTAEERMYERTYLNPEEAHARAQEMLLANQIPLAKFDGLYDEDALRRDANEVARLEGKFEQTSSKIYGDILEAVICEHGELSNWFGPYSQVMKTTPFDDYVNKIDMIIETDEGKGGFSLLALGVDVTIWRKSLHILKSISTMAHWER